MDERKASLILEFLIRQPLDDWVIHRLVSILPISDGDLRLKKSLVLRGIYSDILKDSISEKILESLEVYERLVQQEGSGDLHSLKRAYHAVAVECCVRFLREEFGIFKEFVCAVDRIWKVRVSALEKLDGCILISDQLRKSKKEMIKAVSNFRVRTGLLGMDTREEAMDSIRAFWEESVQEMGLSSLESQAKVQCEEGKGVEQIPDEHPHDDHVTMGGWNVKAMKHDVVAMDNDKTFPPSSADMDGGNLPPGEVEALIRDVNDTVGRSYANQDSGAMNQDATDTNGITRNSDPLSTHEFRKLQRALIESSKNLKLVVEDPLPEALDAAEKVQYNSITVQEDATTHEQIQNQSSVDRNDAPIGETYGRTHGEMSTSNQNDKNHNGTSWPGFMSRNPTAQTYKWDEDLGESPSDNSSRSKGVRLPSPSQRVISPLKMQDMKKFARRRRIKKWSALEEETLRNAVLKHGKGNWKFILKNYSTVFEDRTEVDLKDKWRNMVR